MPAQVVRRVSVGTLTFRAAFLCLVQVLAASGTIFQVSNANDSGVGSLRQAILDANANAGTDLISFQVAGPGVHTITPLSILPPLLDPVVIDGSTQPGYSGQPLIELNGASAGNNSGLRVLAGNCTVRGLAINRFGGSGIQIEGDGTNLVLACCLGTDASGTAARPNGQEGVWIYNSSGNVIGGTSILDGNIISGNADSGVYVQNGVGNAILGNLIGTTASGSGRLGNAQNAIVLYNAPGNVVGGGAGGRNIISGNGGSGVFLLGAGASSNRIIGNYVGTTIAGTGGLSNAADGITLSDAPANFVGGTNSAEGNLISGNGKAGIALSGPVATNNLIQGNLIGTTASGAATLSNGFAGVWLSAANHNTIGGDNSTCRNVISGNGQDGILITSDSVGNTVGANYIGVDSTGSGALPNLFSGVSISSSHSNTIGGPVSTAGNVISGNALYGIYLTGGSGGNALQANYIGTDASGTRPLANNRSGVRVESAANSIGGANVISGNTLDGIMLAGTSASNNVVHGNLIGTTASGLARLLNGRAGIGISAAPRNTIGGTLAPAGNLISGNTDAGIYLIDPAATGNLVLGNRIGTDLTGSAALGNTLEGIYLQDAPGNTIGATAPGGGNVISGNRTRGIFLTNASWNSIQSNLIGLAADTTSALPNAFHNVEAESGATNNSITANSIASAPAPYCGVRVRNGSLNNRIDANSIFGNGALGIDLGVAGVAPNDACDGDTGANNLQNYPVLSQAVSGEASAVKGTLNSNPMRTFALQFFASPTCDSSGYGEAQLYLGQAFVTTDSSCRADFLASFPVSLPAGWTISATATDSAGNTSEFCACVPVLRAPLLAFAVLKAGQLTLSWTNSPSGFVLKQTQGLAPPIAWSTVTNTPLLSNGTWILQLPIAPVGNRFFTLQFE